MGAATSSTSSRTSSHHAWRAAALSSRAAPPCPSASQAGRYAVARSLWVSSARRVGRVQRGLLHPGPWHLRDLPEDVLPVHRDTVPSLAGHWLWLLWREVLPRHV